MMRAEIKHRMTRRLANWDYTRRAIYMITVTLKDRSREWLGCLVRSESNEAQNREGAAASHLWPGGCAIKPTRFGEAVLDALDEMPKRYPQIGIIEKQLMPEHFHFIIFVKAPLDRPLGALIRGFKAGAAKRWRRLAENGQGQDSHMGDSGGCLAENGQGQDSDMGDSCGCLAENGQGRDSHMGDSGGCLAENGQGRNSDMGDSGGCLVENGQGRNSDMGDSCGCLAENGQGRDSDMGDSGGNSCGSVSAHSCAGVEWAEGFQDTVLLHEGQLKAMIGYVRDNPRRLAEKRANPMLFRRVARLELPLDGRRIIGAFEALGNRHLLERPIHQVQCSRRYFAYRRITKPGGGLKIARDATGEPVAERETPDYRARLEDALAAAAHGAVILSPCISDGERQIAREALKANRPLVALKNMGFAKLEKPAGGHFEACAEGRLLLLAPAAWPCSTQAKDMTRFDATALNRIAQWLAGAGAIKINYHGMKPSNIDELAEKAVIARAVRV